jgi:hypothetical protein
MPARETGNDSCSQKINRFLMRYELHTGGHVFVEKNIDEIYKLAETITEEYFIYAYYTSVLHLIPENEEVVKLKFIPPPAKQKRPTVLFPLIPYNDAKKAIYWLAQRIPKSSVHKRLYCSMAALTKSISWYHQTNSQEEYESYNGFKKNLVQSK